MNALSLIMGAMLLLPAVNPTSTTVDDAATIREQVASYPLENCVITGKKLDESAKSVLVEGTLVRVCCGKCAKAVKASPADSIAKVKAAVIAEQLRSYPLETCVVSGESLGDKPVNVVVGTRLVRTCCNDCVKVVNKDAAKYLAQVDTALIAAQIASYPAKTCPVSGKALDSMGDPIDRLYGTKLVRLCCKGCVKSYEKDPAKFAAMVYGRKGATSKPTSKPTSRKAK